MFEDFYKIKNTNQNMPKLIRVVIERPNGKDQVYEALLDKFHTIIDYTTDPLAADLDLEACTIRLSGLDDVGIEQADGYWEYSSDSSEPKFICKHNKI